MASSRRYDTRELLTQLDALEKTVVTPAAGSRGDVVVATTALVPGAANVVTNVASGDYSKFAVGTPLFIVGSGGVVELNAVKTQPTSGTIALQFPSVIDAPLGARVVTGVTAQLGEIGEGGVTITGSATQNDIKSSTSRLPLASTITDGKLGFLCELMGFNIENLQTVFGIPEGAQGAGTLASPFATAIIGRLLGSEGLCAYRARGLMKDGLTQYYLDFVNASVVPNVNSAFGGATAATLGLSGSCTTLVPRIWT